MAASIQIVNGPEIMRNVNNHINKYYTGLKKEIYRAAINTQTGAKRLCPVDTGRLRSSINIHITHSGFGATVNAETNYAYFVEYGTGIYNYFHNGRTTKWMFYSPRYGWRWTSGQRPKLYMTKSWEQERPKFQTRSRNLKL